MTCGGSCFHGPGANSPMTLREHMDGSWEKRAIFITQWHPAADIVLCDGEEDQFSFLPHHWYSLCIFFFHLSVYFLLSGDVRASVCSSPAVTVWVCTDGRQEGHVVYCFRPCGVPAVMDGLGRGFCSGLCVSQTVQVQSVRSLAAKLKAYTDKFRPKTGVSPRRVFCNISIKIQSPDIDHPSSAVSVLGVSHWKNWNLLKFISLIRCVSI